MNKLSFWLVTTLSLVVISLQVYAKETIALTKNLKFDPVAWRITQVTGGFSILNETTKKQFIQVVVNEGAIGTFKITKQNERDCVASLGGISVTKSTVCELAPNERLFIDKDFADQVDATGTYQVQIVS